MNQYLAAISLATAQMIRVTAPMSVYHYLCAFSIIYCRLSQSSAISDYFVFPLRGLIGCFLIFNALVG